MALIVDPDLLADSALDDASQEVYINTVNKTIKLVQTGDLSTDGVTLKALYSFLKEEWKDDPNTKGLAAFPFPMVPITDESFEFVEGWDFDAVASEELIRTAGWVVRNTGGSEIKRFSGVIILGNPEANDQLYYNLGTAAAATGATDFALTGAINQAVQVIDDPNGDGNYVDGFDRSDSIDIFLREQAQLYDKVDNAAIGVTTLGPIAYRFPLNTGADLNIDTIDTDIASGGSGAPDTAPYSGMTITYENTTVTRSGFSQADGDFGITVNANNNTLVDTFNFVQYMLRQTIDINADTPSVVNGNLADELMYWVGPTLYTQRATSPETGLSGVFINNIAAADINNVILVDDAGDEKSYPFTATLTLNFNSNLQNDTGPAKYWVYYTTTPVVGRTGTDGNIGAAGTTFTSASASFVANDVDSLIRIDTVGPAAADLYTRIVSITNGTTVEVEDAATGVGSAENWEIYGGDWGERGALLAETDVPVDMTGNVAGASVALTYDYDGNNQANLGVAGDKAITVVASGTDIAQYVRATGTIERSASNSVTLVSPLERNYDNPV